MSVKFDSFRVDLEDNHTASFHRIISSVATDAYNEAITDAIEAVNSLLPDQPELRGDIMAAIARNYVK